MTPRVVESTPVSNKLLPTLPRSRYGRWRALTLTGVYVFMVIHVLHWTMTGKTLAPLELNEVMYTFELGIVTAGFIFMAIAVLATSIFGRFFCSWGCHILALQDLCAWLLDKLRIRPAGIRSRLLLWVPVVAACYMFLWPQVVRLWEGRALATLHFRTDADGWASFATENFWRNLPGPGIIALTFAVCGFAIVYVLGSRGFCNYGCPYGAIFGLVDRLAPGRIRVGNDCLQCGKCTAVCGSHVRVHEELDRFGMVVNPACMKDLDCVSVCPQQSLHYGFGRPSLLRKTVGDARVRKQYDFGIAEELFMVVMLVAVLVVFRGLYDRGPFLMTLGLGAIVAYLCVVLVRLFRHEAVTLNRWSLKAGGRVLPHGWLFVTAMSGFLIFAAHSGYIRYHYLQGRRQYHLAMASGGGGPMAQSAKDHLTLVQRWGLLSTHQAEGMMADICLRQERWAEARSHLQRVFERTPGDVWAMNRMVTVATRQGRFDEAIQYGQAALAIDPNHAETHYRLAGVYYETRDAAAARKHLLDALRLQPEYAEAHFDLGALLVELGEMPQGITHLLRALELKPEYAEAHHNLSVALAMTGQLDDAMTHADRAVELNPEDEQTRLFREHLQSLRNVDAGR